MLVFVGPRRESEGTTGVQLKMSLFTVPSPEVPHGTWSIIVTEKNGGQKERKTAFSFLRSMGLAIGSPRAGESVYNERVK